VLALETNLIYETCALEEANRTKCHSRILIRDLRNEQRVLVDTVGITQQNDSLTWQPWQFKTP